MPSITMPPDYRGQGARTVEALFKTKPLPPPPSTTFAGQTAIITGSNQGLGLRCSEIMLEHHLNHLIMAVRSIDKGEKAASLLRKAHPSAKIDVWALDMLSYESVQSFAQRVEQLQRLDVAILNAGYWEMGSWHIEPSTGHETTVQVNYISTALLAILLLPIMKRSSQASQRPGRLSIISSGLAMAAKFENANEVPLIPSFDRLGAFSVGAGQERYSTTKAMVCMLVYKLSQFITADQVIVNAVDPGFTKGTALLRGAKGLMKIGVAAANATARTIDQGTWCYIDGIVTKGKESHGSYLTNWRVNSFPSLMYTPKGKQTTERLWEETLQELDFAGVRSVMKSLN
ncbi:hypothetical protein LTR17_000317 [Elasticomyces elasticus]|nr:hypothetical protein LTR17_000317 [Elasticomyces elasticus]